MPNSRVKRSLCRHRCLIAAACLFGLAVVAIMCAYDTHAGLLSAMVLVALCVTAGFLKRPERFVNPAIVYLVANLVIGYFGDIHALRQRTPFLVFQLISLLSLWGLISFFRRRQRRKSDVPLRSLWRLLVRGTEGKDVAITMVLSAGVIVFASMMWFFYIRHGNIPMLAEDPRVARFEAFDGSRIELGLTRFFFRIGFEFTAILVALLMAIGVSTRLPAKVALGRYFAAGYGLAPLMLSGTRSGLLTPLAVWGYAWILATKNRGKPVFVKAITVALAVVAIFAGLGNWRDAQMMGPSMATRDRLYMSAPSFREGLLVWNRIRDTRQYNYGLSYLSDMLCFVPSAYFPFRREYDWTRQDLRLLGFASEDAQKMGGIAQTMFVAFFQSGGYVGVAVGILAYAWCVAAMERWIRRRPPPVVLAGILLASILLLRTIRSKGLPFVQLMMMSATLVITAACAGVFFRRRRRDSSKVRLARLDPTETLY